MGRPRLKRRILYVTGTRADFGLMKSTLRCMAADPRIDLSVCVTGQHLEKAFGRTMKEVEASGLAIAGRVPVDLAEGDGAMMARAIGRMVAGITGILIKHRYDGVLLLGDRGEMIAGALAAIHLNVPVFHIHGGELTGTVDEPVRHAISKLSHYHFTATREARQRLVRMGEQPRRVFVTGAPGLDELKGARLMPRAALARGQGLDSAKPIALVLFHPVLQEAREAGLQMRNLLAATRKAGYQILCLKPNSDAGNHAIVAAIDDVAARDGSVRVVTHLPRQDYISWLAAADMLVGNSSSGIIEAASFNLPVVNVGSRQNGRQQSGNVVNASTSAHAIGKALAAAARLRGRRFANVYGKGDAGARITALVATLPLTEGIMSKSNAY
jgi:GDP/UDP-N,N'-diacetylbacillosamine 2-epimerase (hydrolysing)